MSPHSVIDLYHLPMAEITRYDAERVVPSQVGSQNGSKCRFNLLRNSSNQYRDNRNVFPGAALSTQVSEVKSDSPLEDLSDVWKVHFNTMLSFIGLDSKCFKLICGPQLRNS